MQGWDIPISNSKNHKFLRRGPARLIPIPMEINTSTTYRLITMNARLESRLRSTLKELDELRKFLDEANTALASAGVPYKEGNIRERISAYQVFKHIMKRPV